MSKYLLSTGLELFGKYLHFPKEENLRILINYATIYYEKKLSQTNPYLLDRAKRLSCLVISVGSSSAIEGVSANVFLKNYLLKKMTNSFLIKLN